MKKPHVFIRFHENGEHWDDFSEWVEGVFASLKSAMKDRPGLFRRIEEWVGDERVAIYNLRGEKKVV
jgi:hypothetical protein